MGDIVHGLPAAAFLKERLPDLELSWLVEPPGMPLLAGNPVIDQVIVFPKKKWQQQLRSVSGMSATAAEARQFLGKLKTAKFDAVLDLQGLFKSSLLGFLSSANLRLGFKGTREGADRLLTHKLDVGDYFGHETHVVELNLRLADYAVKVLSGEVSDTNIRASAQSYVCDMVRFPLPAPPVETKQKIAELLKNNGIKGSPIQIFIPGTTWKTKIWDPDNWIQFGKLCRLRYGNNIILIGGPSESEMNGNIARGLESGVLDLTGKTSIVELIALFQESDIVIGADTGPLHLAAAVGKPQVLAIFGSTPPLRNGPYGPQCSTVSLKLDCQPCFEKICPLGTLACLKNLSPERVFNQVCAFREGDIS